MDLQRVLHMNGGEGDASYAKNSNRQRTVLYKIKPMIEEAIQEGHVLISTTSMAKSLAIADLGCASGPNTFLAISMIIDAIYKRCTEMGSLPPELQLFLNDLPGNDFNSVFKDLPAFYDRLQEERGDEFRPCFVFGAPGSFYGRLFASRSLHFVCSNMALHWLSQIPPGLENSNSGNVCVCKTSPLSVYQAYAEQFKTDFTYFLKMRAQEMIPGGRMVLSLMSRNKKDPFSSECRLRINHFAIYLNNMVSMGILEEETMDTFNLPFYDPCIEEVRGIIEAEGSFYINQLEEVQLAVTNVNFSNKIEIANTVANEIKAIFESTLRAHFGNAAIDKLFKAMEEQKPDEKLSAVPPDIDDYLVASLTRREY